MRRIPLAPLLVMLAGSLLLTPAAAKEEPDATIKTPTIEASVSVDPALKAYRGLYPHLLAAGKREMGKWQVDADKARQEIPQIFRDGRRYEFERHYKEESAIGPYISIVRTDFIDSLGAHPNTIINTLLWNTSARKFVSIRPFFTEAADNGPTMQALAAAVRAAVLAAKKARHIPPEIIDNPMWLDGIKPSLLKIGAAALAPSTEHGKSAGLLFYFSPYDVAPYVEGAYTVFVPWTVFKTHLSQDGAELFAGTRPQ
ncbi:MAG TPA: RsiV family protein [Pseudolabrys sp.]|jgi:hypothetical protein|nr:RsiV family protein [Pseudolabrys sp.]